MIHLVGPKTRVKDVPVINTTSRSTTWSKGLSPFFLGPIKLYDGTYAANMENCWQYTKVYDIHIDNQQNPTPEYFAWARAGWNKNYADRYPMGKNTKPLFSWWNGEKLDYIKARKTIYAKLYAEAVEKTQAYKNLTIIYQQQKEIWLWDFDSYDHHKLNMSYKDVINDPTRKMGHAFVLAMALDNERVWENE